ncbi:hypothetical protein dqs_2511 [Azoarcus olearius]|uniref:hypothetical protein n=1 Tax=Azoarcus sp. (strain BH72) TaxID=418699 RepID=UPI000806124D|nr:hypothetical protein [Azoarcus olearius]ANQ85541.1 hypothetical protein dqs_2511 [Azoarcus olearius]
MKGYPSWFLPVLIVIVLAVAASGLLLVPTTLQLRAEIDPGWRLAAATRIGVGASHTAAAFLISSVAGALAPIHVRAGWRRRRHLASGALLLALLALLATSAVGVFYLADEQAANLCAYAHIGLSAAFLLLITWHGLTGWATRRHASCTVPAPTTADG